MGGMYTEFRGSCEKLVPAMALCFIIDLRYLLAKLSTPELTTSILTFIAKRKQQRAICHAVAYYTIY